MFEKELQQARERLANQEKELAMAREAYAAAVKNNMPATAKVTGAKVKRYEFAVALSAEQVRELEKACGVLPLEGGGGKRAR